MPERRRLVRRVPRPWGGAVVVFIAAAITFVVLNPLPWSVLEAFPSVP